MSIAFSFTPPASSSINKSIPSFSISPSSIRFSPTLSLPPFFHSIIHRQKDLPLVLHSFGGGVEDYSYESPNQEVGARKALKRKLYDSPASNGTYNDNTGNEFHDYKITPRSFSGPGALDYDPKDPINSEMQNIKGISSRDNRAIEVNFEKGNGKYILQLTSVPVENTMEEKALTAALLYSQADVLRELGDHLLSEIRESVQSDCYQSLNIDQEMLMLASLFMNYDTFN